jgi:polyhydroxyalkanoate synthesis regulator protein
MTTTNRKNRIIKRYQNRKLYDTNASRYVTLDDIATLIREGEDVQIIDNQNQDDLTSVTLTQIIFEQEKKRRACFRCPRSGTSSRAAARRSSISFRAPSSPA